MLGAQYAVTCTCLLSLISTLLSLTLTHSQERHLQEVILAQQTNCRHEVYIPTPEVAVDVAHYEHIYQKILNRQCQYIRVPGTPPEHSLWSWFGFDISSLPILYLPSPPPPPPSPSPLPLPPALLALCIGLGLEEEVPDYDLDTEDDEWLNAQTKERVRDSGLPFIHFFTQISDCCWIFYYTLLPPPPTASLSPAFREDDGQAGARQWQHGESREPQFQCRRGRDVCLSMHLVSL